MKSLENRLERSRRLSWEKFGKHITFYLPGMFSYHGLTGKYPALSITGSECALQCDHCRGKILETMISSPTSEDLIAQCHRLAEKGNKGVLISGGCDEEGRLPWDSIIPAIMAVKKETNLYVSVHCGLLDLATAIRLKEAGVDQALIDVIGDDETYRDIYHVPFGISRIEQTLKSLRGANLSMIPHIVCGLNYGQMKGEKKAVEMISRYPAKQVVIVSLMGIRGTPAWGSTPPAAKDVAEIIAETRFHMPDARISLGCARQRGNTPLEIMAIDAGINRMALPSEEAIQHAVDYGLEIRYQRTCCSVSEDLSKETW